MNAALLAAEIQKLPNITHRTQNIYIASIAQWQHHAHTNPHSPYHKWPLACVLGYILYNPTTPLQDENTTQTDFIWVGVQPQAITHIVQQWAQQLQRAYNKSTLTYRSTPLYKAWVEANNTATFAACELQRAINITIKTKRNKYRCTIHLALKERDTTQQQQKKAQGTSPKQQTDTSRPCPDPRCQVAQILGRSRGTSSAATTTCQTCSIFHRIYQCAREA